MKKEVCTKLFSYFCEANQSNHGLTLSQTSPGFHVSAEEDFGKHYGKR